MNKKIMFATILLMVVGFATISTTLFINGNAVISETDDFNVYFSDSYVNGAKDLSVIESETSIRFFADMYSVDKDYVLEYDVTNSSKNYDAELIINCTGGNEYLNVTNEFDINTPLGALETRRGKLTIDLVKSYLGAIQEVPITCTITATATERTGLAEGEAADPANNPYKNGTKVEMADEFFYITGADSSTVYLLSEKAIVPTVDGYRQTDAEEGFDIPFADVDGWEYLPGPKEIDLATYAPTIQEYLDGYESYIEQETGNNVEADLMTITQLRRVGCTAAMDYTYNGTESCPQEVQDWLYQGQAFWTKSASTDTQMMRVWVVVPQWKAFWDQDFRAKAGVRPVIAVPIEYANQLLGL